MNHRRLIGAAAHTCRRAIQRRRAAVRCGFAVLDASGSAIHAGLVATQVRRAGIGLALGLIAGCSTVDPYLRPGMWQPDGVNAGNIAAMVADPRDMIRAQHPPAAAWKTGAAAVDRLWQDKAKPLLSTTHTPTASDAPPAAGAH